MGAGLGGRTAVRPHDSQVNSAHGVLDVGHARKALRRCVAISQGRGFAARPVDDRRVPRELQSGDRSARADILEEHLDAEVHRDVAASGVLAATEQRRVLPFAGGNVVGRGRVDPVWHDAVAAEARHQRGCPRHFAGVPHRRVGLERNRRFAGDVLHHAVTDAA